MKVIEYPEREDWPAICQRPSIDTKFLERTVADILDEVSKNGDAALRHYAKVFDAVELDEFRVSEQEFADAETTIPQELKEAIAAAKKNIERFHGVAAGSSEVIETMPGVSCWRRRIPIASVGLYVPAGSAPLFSTVLMLAVPAKLAGCERIVITTPPDRDGKAAAAVLYTAQLCGVAEVYKIGGAQAIAALAYGSETLQRVDKIFGPGNQFVTEAKLQVLRSGVGIDMPAGPSEVAILADGSCVPAYLAADLLAQAEHGPDSQVILVSDDREVIENVIAAMEDQMPALPRRDIAKAAVGNSRAILTRSIDEGIDLLNAYAAEHLIIATSNAGQGALKVRNAGSVFVGELACESAGDYASGTNHTLPTGGAARSYSGISTQDFMKTITFQQLTTDGLLNLAPIVETMAAAEGLDAHRNAMAIRRIRTQGGSNV